MYTYNYNRKTQQWDVYFHGVYVCSFATEREARDFCNYANQQRS